MSWYEDVFKPQINSELLIASSGRTSNYDLSFNLSLGKVSGQSERYGKFKDQRLMKKYGFNVRSEKYTDFVRIWDTDLQLNEKLYSLLEKKIIWKPKSTSYTHIDYYENKIKKIYEKVYGNPTSNNMKELKQIKQKLERTLNDVNSIIENSE